MIENRERRVVNFLFVNPFPVRLNEFSNRLRKFFDNKLDEYVEETEAKINAYIEKLKNDEIEESENVSYPITFKETPHLTFDVSTVGRIALTTADDPFFKLPPNHRKYYPELVIYNKEGEIIEVIDESKAGIETITKGMFESNCRDSKMKINDDRKASISLMLQKDVQMVVLVIRSRDLSDQPDVKKGEFDRAQFRLIDDETNQSLDEAQIKNIKLTVPTPEGEGDEEPPQAEPEEEEDEENPQKKPQNVIVLGRVFLDNEKWIYEQYHYMFKEDKHPDFFTRIGHMEAQAREYFSNKENQIKEEEKALNESREAAAQAAAAKAASKKGKKSKKGEEKKEKETEKEPEKEQVSEEHKIDIDHMPGFREAIEGIHSTVFGPIAIELKDEQWDEQKVEKAILKKMKDELGDKIKNCIHGFEVCVPRTNAKMSKKRILKYSRNVQNLQVRPVIPPEVEPKEKPVNEGEGQGESESEQD
jgi:hypothetical protein